MHWTKQSTCREVELPTMPISEEAKKNQVSHSWQFYGKIFTESQNFAVRIYKCSSSQGSEGVYQKIRSDKNHLNTMP